MLSDMAALHLQVAYYECLVLGWWSNDHIYPSNFVFHSAKNIDFGMQADISEVTSPRAFCRPVQEK